MGTGMQVEVQCKVVEWVKNITLKWFGQINRMTRLQFVKVCESEVEDPGTRESYIKYERWDKGANVSRIDS